MGRKGREGPDGSDFIIATKGAPEAIADLCHLDEPSRLELSGNIKAMANEGLRVLGVAAARFKNSNLPQGQHDFEFQFIGLVGLADPVRPGVAEAVKECYDAGIRVDDDNRRLSGNCPGHRQTDRP